MGYYILVATNQDMLPFQLLTFEPTFLTSELKGKGHKPSRAELKILQLGSGSSLVITFRLILLSKKVSNV